MSAGSVERRAWVRHPCNVETSCNPPVDAEGAEWTGQIRDISLGGVGVLLNRRFEKGAVLSIEMQDKSGRATYTLLGRVVRVTKHPDGNWLLGCAFANKLTDEEVAALL